MRWLLTAAGAVAGLATIAGSFGSASWFLDLFSHFRVQYFFGLALVAIALLIFKWKWVAAAFFALALVNLSLVLPLYISRADGGPPSSSRTYRALLANVNTRHGDPDRLAALIEDAAPGILVLEEVDARWIERLEPALTSFPHSVVEPRSDNFGIALYSAYPLSSAGVTLIGQAEVPSIIATAELPDGDVSLLATHPLPPFGPDYSWHRNQQLAELPDAIQGLAKPVLLLGDLNATPWSPHYRKLLRRSGLLDSMRGHGVQSTWPVGNALLRIPLDHCLHDPGIQITGRKTGPDIGSDHFPLIIEFTL